MLLSLFNCIFKDSMKSMNIYPSSHYRDFVYLRSFKLEKGDSWLVSDPEVVGPSPGNSIFLYKSLQTLFTLLDTHFPFSCICLTRRTHI